LEHWLAVRPGRLLGRRGEGREIGDEVGNIVDVVPKPRESHVRSIDHAARLEKELAERLDTPTNPACPASTMASEYLNPSTRRHRAANQVVQAWAALGSVVTYRMACGAPLLEYPSTQRHVT
jgi:hypothetical protein